MRRFLVVLLALAFVSGFGIASPYVALAQEATPEAEAAQFPIVPDPANCAGEPITAEELLVLWYAPDGSPIAVDESAMAVTEVTIPVGAPAADDDTAAAVIDTVNRVFSCFTAGDALRAYALFTEDLVRKFGPEPGTSREEAEAFLTGEFDSEGEDEQSEIVAITDVTVLDDGRVAAFVVDYSTGEYTTAYVLFEQVEGSWLVDDVIEFGLDDEEFEGTPTA